ncbi:MAG: NAD(P)H-quinone oxidoreductase subunit M [Cyanobacteriota bacterium]|nr:NAD(P)H-quinone oxidoreductase subunit M [Cyanobacteriota bacterium]
MLKSITRHVHIFAAEITDSLEMVPRDNLLTLDVDPDNELVWNDQALQAVYDYFDQRVADFAGRDLTEYNLRRIGSDVEHLIRSLLRQGKLAYNLNSRVLNYSMGFPQVPAEQISGQYLPSS